MNSIRRRFLKIKETNPYWSDYTCFAETIRSRNLSRETIHTHFNKLIPRDEYRRAEKLDILAYLGTI